MTFKCDKPWADHPVHGKCTRHIGWAHTTVKDGETFAWPDRELTDGSKKGKTSETAD